MTQYFGLFAFSGKVTAFLAPLTIAAVTSLTGSQRAGMAIILAFLLAGLRHSAARTRTTRYRPRSSPFLRTSTGGPLSDHEPLGS